MRKSKPKTRKKMKSKVTKNDGFVPMEESPIPIEKVVRHAEYYLWEDDTKWIVVDGVKMSSKNPSKAMDLVYGMQDMMICNVGLIMVEINPKTKTVRYTSIPNSKIFGSID